MQSFKDSAFDNAFTNRNEFLLVFVSLFAIVLLFNYPDIFVSKTLFLDDYDRYVRGIENRVHEYIIDRNFARAYVVFGLYKLLAIDASLARFALVALFYVPLATLFYYLLRKHAKLPPAVAFFSSLLPCILPGQVEIPRFIDGSYTVPGLLVYLLYLLSSFKFLELRRFSLAWLAISVLLGILSVEMMDQAIFMLPFSVAAFFLISYGKSSRSRFLLLSTAATAISVAKATIIYLEPSSTATPVTPSIEVFIQRTGAFWSYTVPFAHRIKGQTVGSSALLVTFSLFLALIAFGFWASSIRNKAIIILCLIWAFSSSIVFLTISEYYSSRYIHIAAFGMNTAIFVSIWQILKSRFSEDRYRRVFIIIAVSVSIYSGTSRINHVYAGITPLNQMQDAIESTLGSLSLPRDSQIVILEKYRSPTHGWWRYSSGFMKFTTKRHDITGQIGAERGFYPAFNPAYRLFHPDHRMSGIDKDKPVFIFRQTCKEACTHEQLQAALHWTEDGWSLYVFDRKDGSLVEEHTGSGQQEFIDLIKANNLRQEDIAFGSK